MAVGTVSIFNQFVEDVGEEVHNLESDTLKLAIITTTVTPNVTDATPAWGTSSGVDYDGNEVGVGNGYTDDGETLASVGWDISGATATLTAADISLTQNGAGFTNGGWGILYNDSAVSSQAIGFVELSTDGDLSLQDGDININWNASGILTITRT